MAWTLFGSNWLTGIICMWHGLLVDIPNGWALCDGSNGTPDLRARFVRGAAAGIDPGGTGGTTVHAHLTSGNTGYDNTQHSHWIDGWTGGPGYGIQGYNSVGGGTDWYWQHQHVLDLGTEEDGSYHRHTFFDVTSTVGHLPPYYDVAFIMKL